LSTGDKSYLSKAARGGGQYIIVIEELDLVVVVTAHNRNFNDDTSSLTAKRILPAFIQFHVSQMQFQSLRPISKH